MLEKREKPEIKQQNESGIILSGLREMIFNENAGSKLTCMKYFPKTNLIGCGLDPELGGGFITV